MAGSPVQLSSDTVLYTTTASGRIEATFTATDEAGHSSTSSTTFTVIDPNDFTSPLVSLDDEDCIDISDRYSVTGSISDDNEVFYGLFYRDKGTANWTTFAQGSGFQPNGVLGVFDPTVFKNGVYELALYAEDLNQINRGQTTFLLLVT